MFPTPPSPLTRHCTMRVALPIVEAVSRRVCAGTLADQPHTPVCVRVSSDERHQDVQSRCRRSVGRAKICAVAPRSAELNDRMNLRDHHVSRARSAPLRSRRIASASDPLSDTNRSRAKSWRHDRQGGSTAQWPRDADGHSAGTIQTVHRRHDQAVHCRQLRWSVL